MKKKLIFVIGYLLMGIASVIGIALNVVTLVQGEDLGSGWTLAEMIAFIVVFAVILGISVHQSIIWILRIVKDREIVSKDYE